MSNARRRYFRFWKNISAEVDDELRFHIESRIQEYIASGMTVDEARDAAMQRFGNIDTVRDRCRTIDQQHEQDRRRKFMWETVLQDLRYAGRALRRNPGFTLVAVLTLALGIGANTAIFSVVNGVLLRPLPYAEPERLVTLFTTFSESGRYSMSQPEFMDYKGLTNIFENAAAYTGTGMTLTGVGEPERVRGVAVTRDLLPVLGIAPLKGRNFQNDEGRQGTEPVVILAYDFWKNRLGGDSAAVGRVLTLNGINRRVIGILPPEKTIDRAEAFVPTYINPDSMRGRASNYLSGIARLKRGVTVEQAQRALNALTKESRQKYPTTYPATQGYGAEAVPMHEEIVGDIKPALMLLLGAVALVLLIACANVANLLLARGEARQREVAVRMAIGAGRGRVIRQLLTESVALAMLGATVGVALAWWGMRSILVISPDTIPRLDQVRIDPTVGLVTLGVTVLTALLFGLAPALQLTRPDLQSSLKEGTRGASEGVGRQSFGRALVMGEIALSVVVVIGAVMLVRSFDALRRVDPGFKPDHLLAIDLALPGARYDTQATINFYRQLTERLRALPGVQGVALASDMPPAASGNNFDVLVEGRSRKPDETLTSPNVRFVSAGFFKTLGIPIVRGRSFGVEDSPTGMPVAIINEATAKTLFGTEDPVGKRVSFGSKQPWLTIVGVSKDVHSMGMAAPPPIELYTLDEQLPAWGGGAQRAMYVTIRTSVNPMTLASASRRVIREMDPNLAIIGIRTVEEMIDLSIARQRFTMTLLTAFGLVALVLAAIGIYGIMSYSVKRRTRELGIRMALGAQRGDVLRLVVKQGMRLVTFGLVSGVVVAALSSRYIKSLLFGIKESDPSTYLLTAFLLASVALLATWIPARRAVLTDPSVALRAE